MVQASADGISCYCLLMKDLKPICRIRCFKPPCEIELQCLITDIVRLEKIGIPAGLPCCTLYRASENAQQEKEWVRFLDFLQTHKKVEKYDIFSMSWSPGGEKGAFHHVTALYKQVNRRTLCDHLNELEDANGVIEVASRSCKQRTHIGEDALSNTTVIGDKTVNMKANRGPENVVAFTHTLPRNSVQVHPSYLKTLGQSHSSWIFGAVAEFVDNSRDAKATKLEISIGTIYHKPAGRDIPMLSIIDNGEGMTHEQIERMISFGHKQPDADDPDRIGRFGIGFKSGAMRLGKDAVVFTQAANSRSVAFLSQTLNEGKDNLEIPIVSFRRVGQFMEIDTSVQNETLAKHNLKAIMKFSPFNKYLIGEKSALFGEAGTGTQIYIWNLDEWGSSYSLCWETETKDGSSSCQGDISINPRRVRSRPGQMSQEVPLDYSLKSYLEVIFRNPRMKISVQGALIKTRPLSKSLHQTVVKTGVITGKTVKLILGRSQLEWEQANCGIFLYWHGRLIEAYKRVGSMIHNGDTGRGIIGVIDLTDLMKDDRGRVWVHNNKQGFQDCEAYAELEKWLCAKTDEYLDKYVNKIQLVKDGAFLKADREWVQCDKCRKWRMLPAGFDSSSLPIEWTCDIPEQKEEDGVVIISAKRSGYSGTENLENSDTSPRNIKSNSLHQIFQRVAHSPSQFRNYNALSFIGNSDTGIQKSGKREPSQSPEDDIPLSWSRKTKYRKY
ncbi:OLC1v1010448C1 [Oldenlandia corymbosa var. corymbosa]|uniref:OLC1v1010448C1 n=1 Tax=Oldenlandia corymbosa var. corymbosa TaxID=529605 RepID=A0AAV1DT25_OLDCO|nr:OLC1v1010448C1 [Oldenlandia corymbosa var. corymbosa]